MLCSTLVSPSQCPHSQPNFWLRTVPAEGKSHWHVSVESLWPLSWEHRRDDCFPCSKGSFITGPK